MANYSLVINSQFQPFTLDRYLQPYKIYGEAYKAQEDALAEYATKTEEIGSKINPLVDKETYQMYNNYMNNLKSRVEDLNLNGLSPYSRKSVLDMRSDFGRTMAPILDAWNRRAEQIKEQRSAGNSRINEYDAKLTSLDRYLKDSGLSYSSIDRQDLYKRAHTDFSNIAKSLDKYGKGYEMGSIDAFTKAFIQRNGITREEASNFMDAIRSGNIDAADPDLYTIYKALYDSTSVDSWNNTDAANQVMETILEGVGSAIGDTKVSPMEDWGKRAATNHAYDMARQNDAQAFQAGEAAKQREYNLRVAGLGDGDIDSRGMPTASGLKKLTGGGAGKPSEGNVGRIDEPVVIYTDLANENNDTPFKTKKTVTVNGVKKEKEVPVEWQVEDILKEDDTKTGIPTDYDHLPGPVQEQVDMIIKNDDSSNYQFRIERSEPWFGSGTYRVKIIPKKIGKETKNDEIEEDVV